MIQSFKDSRTRKIYEGQLAKGFPADILKRAIVKLDQLDEASMLDDMRIPPGNQLEALKGTRQGQHSIRINAQWRVCFVWRDGHAYEVEVADYH